MESLYDHDLEVKYSTQINSLLKPPCPEAVQEYFEKLSRSGHGVGLKVKPTVDMGKGVFVAKPFEEEELVLHERMLVGAQHFSNKAEAFVCSFCFCYIGSIGYQIGRRLLIHQHVKHDQVNGCGETEEASCSDSGGRTELPKDVVTSLLDGSISLPYSEHFPLPSAVNCIGGCSEHYFCSDSCAEAAWESFHCLLCTGERSFCRNVAKLTGFKHHADETNDIFHVAAQVISMVILKSKKLGTKLDKFEDILDAWKPFAVGYKKEWWDCIALPDDIDPAEEPQFRKELKDLAWSSLQFLKEALFEDVYAPLFSLRVYGSIIGMFELNNLDLVVASPVEDYFIYIDDLPESRKVEAEKITKPLFEALGDDYAACCEGTAFFPIQSCINHSCDPNCKAFKRDQDKDGRAVLIALRAIQKDEQISISYIDEDLNFEERQSLLSDYGFTCRCSKCLQEAKSS